MEIQRVTGIKSSISLYEWPKFAILNLRISSRQVAERNAREASQKINYTRIGSYDITYGNKHQQRRIIQVSIR